jgi:3-deoxy-D-manno-octulosonic-acid transferase
MNNFRESAELILSCGGGVQVHDGRELAAVLARLLNDPAERQDMGENGAGLLERNSGSTGLHLEIVARFLKDRR